MTRAQDRRLLRLWSEKVRERDKHCQWIYENGSTCRKKEVLHAHHYVGRRGRSTRWYIPNGISLCPLHHTFGTESAHQSSLVLADRLRQKDGKLYSDLLRKSNLIAKNVSPEKVQSHLDGELEYYL